MGFVHHETLGTVDIFGLKLEATRVIDNLRSNPNLALVVDHLVSISPWEVRGLEIRGVAEPLGGTEQPLPGRGRRVTRIPPRSIIGWNADRGAPGMLARNVADEPRVA